MNKSTPTEMQNLTLDRYRQLKPKFGNLATNLAQALHLLFKEHSIAVLSIDFRIKEEDSFARKVEKKGYEEPMDQIEDLCGIRVICFYQSDVGKISEIIEKEFVVLESEDKEELLDADQFGYRSTHFIVRIKKNWLQAPNYRGLENLKAEIQVRTVLMHAWAEIEHKLSYKKDSHIPKQFKRTFSRISAKLEEADEQFEELRNSVQAYRTSVVEITNEGPAGHKEIDLNLDSLQAFFDSTFPDRTKNIEATADLLDELLRARVSLSDLHAGSRIVLEHLRQIEIDLEKRPLSLSQVGITRAVLDITHDKYLEERVVNGTQPKSWTPVIQRWQKRLKSAK